MFFIHRFISLNTSKLILDQNKVSSKIFLVLIWSCLLIIKSHWSKVYEKIKTKKEKMCTYQGNYFITLHPKQKKNEILYSHPNVYNLVHLYYILCSNKDCLHKKWKHCVHWGRKKLFHCGLKIFDGFEQRLRCSFWQFGSAGLDTLFQ